MNNTSNSHYAIPCATNNGSVFFVTLNTKIENEAIRLSKIICSKDVIIILDENGQVWNI